MSPRKSPGMVSLFFPQISQRREDTYIAGLSMGGYGALKIAMTYPERFAAAGSFSGVLDIAGRMETIEPFRKEEMEWIFGDLNSLSGSKDDLFHLAEGLAAPEGADASHLSVVRYRRLSL